MIFLLVSSSNQRMSLTRKIQQKKKKTVSKVVVVLELPSGGAVTKFCVGDNDDILEVEAQKHTLMLHPKALLFSGIRAGVLDEATDGPNTA